ncbi:MAG: 2Fe-2S iron-sulfur cluster-binding protein [Acidimicrobiales bacterium]
MKFTFDGEPVPFSTGQTVAAALTAHGISTFRKSRRLDQARGQFCEIGNCWECLVEHSDGRSVRACRTPADEDLVLNTARPVRDTLGPASLPKTESVSATVAVVGAGPAGLCATKALTTFGIEVLLLDQESAAGGQLYRRVLDEAPHPASLASDDPLVDYRPGVYVWAAQSASQAHQLWCTGDEILHVTARYVVIATGAQELTLPFPGWQLPGVTTAGAAQVLTKNQGVDLGGAVMIAGSGPFLLPVAKTLSRTADSSWCVDSGSFPELLRPGFALHPERVLAFVSYQSALKSGGTSVLRRHVVAEALGTDHLEAVRVAPIDSGRPDLSRQREIGLDHLAISHGFVPNLDLGLNLDCDVAVDSVFSARLAADAWQRTSVEGIFAAGESTGIGGGPKAKAEGRVAALTIAAELGHRSNTLLPRVRSRRARQFARLVGTAAKPPVGWRDLLTPETIICRCEDVTYGAILDAIALGATDARAVKGVTRCGMGMCQGRTCGPVLQALVSQSTDEPAIGLQRRSVATPVTLSEIAAIGGGQTDA